MRKTLCAAWIGGVAALAPFAEAADADQASGYLDVGGSKIYYETRGAGPAIVLLHDGLLHAVTWDAIWQSLTAGHQVIRYDRRGYGRSEPTTKPYSSIEDLAKLLAHFKKQNAVIAGSSSGGALAIDFAIRHPEMVSGLFLIGPVLHGIDFTTPFRERARRNNEPMERGDIRAWATNWSQDKFLIASANDDARRKVFEALVANAEKLKKFDNALGEQLAPPASQRLSEIKAPTLILTGEADIEDVHTQGKAINAGIRGSELVLVKDAGHLIQLEKPAEVIHRLEEFAARLR